MNKSEIMVVLVTTSSEEEAVAIAKTIVEESLAACANLIPQARSIYSWQDKVCDETETLMIIKTRAELFEKLSRRVNELHSYDTPEIIGMKVDVGSPEYIDWVLGQTEI